FSCRESLGCVRNPYPGPNRRRADPPRRDRVLCDAGMCGPVNSILGLAIEPIMNRFVSNLPASFPVAGGEVRLHGALIEIDEKNGCAARIIRLDEHGPMQPAADAAAAPHTAESPAPK